MRLLCESGQRYQELGQRCKIARHARLSSLLVHRNRMTESSIASGMPPEEAWILPEVLMLSNVINLIRPVLEEGLRDSARNVCSA